MSEKRLQTYYIPVDLVDDLQKVLVDPPLLSRLGFGAAGIREPDHRGLRPEDYEKLREFTGLTLDGDELIEKAWLHPAAKIAVRAYYRKALDRNRRAVLLAAKQPSASRLVAALLRLALEQLTLEKTKANAAVKPAGRKSRDVGQAA